VPRFTYSGLYGKKSQLVDPLGMGIWWLFIWSVVLIRFLEVFIFHISYLVILGMSCFDFVLLIESISFRHVLLHPEMGFFSVSKFVLVVLVMCGLFLGSILVISVLLFIFIFVFVSWFGFIENIR
jgi:hypothetical protein